MNFSIWTIEEKTKIGLKLAACWNMDEGMVGEFVIALERQHFPVEAVLDAIQRIFGGQEIARRPTPQQIGETVRDIMGGRSGGENRKPFCGLRFHHSTPEREASLATLRELSRNHACAFSEEYQCWYAIRPDGIEREVYEAFGGEKKPYTKFTPYAVLSADSLDRLIIAAMKNQNRQDLQARARPKSFEEFKARALGGKTNLAEKEIEWLQSKRSKDALIDVQEEPGADG